MTQGNHYPGMQYTTKKLLIGIRKRENDVLRFIYQEYFGLIKNYILSNGGKETDAGDIFQGAIVIIFKNLKNRDFRLNCSFGAYMLGLCKIIWIQRRKDYVSREEPLKEEYECTPPNEDKLLEEYRQNLRNRLFQKHFKTLEKHCRKVLKMFYSNRPFEEIASEMGYKNADVAKRRKYLCLKYLIEKIKADPEFRRLSQD
jgi:RNA polymerase sigma factor (sigma-70 family)